LVAFCLRLSHLQFWWVRLFLPMLRFVTIIAIITAGSCGANPLPLSSARPMRPGFSVGGRRSVFAVCGLGRRLVRRAARRSLVYSNTVEVVVVEVDEVDVVVVGVMSNRVSTEATVVPMVWAMSAALIPWLLSCLIWAL
jgi:hypothetical protein